ncbi:MAG: hypothetical protein JXX28_04625 [Deltaproteobacteria bacterium]|nr:hypothetical protein [Deltaproteobacteria bacterium]
MTYEKIADYHIALRAGDPPRISRRGKSKCAASLNVAQAQALLEGGYRVPEGADDPEHVYAKHATPAGWLGTAARGADDPEHVYAKHEGTWY